MESKNILQISQEDLVNGQFEIIGGIDEDIFQLDADDAVRFLPPIRVNLTAELIDGNLLVLGHVAASFMQRCVRCLRENKYDVEMGDYQVLLEDFSSQPTFDLTKQIRDDLLLGLPNYPHCPDGTAECRVYPKATVNDSEEKKTDWSALDDLEAD